MSDKRLLDKTWRINNLYKIRDKNKQLIKFKRNRAQEHFQKNKWYRNIILKSRQLGFTTDESIDSLDDTLFTKNNESLLIAQDLDAAKAIFDKKIDLAWNALRPEFKALYRVDKNTAQTLKFDFGDQTFSSIAVDTTGRSGTFNRVHVTEFADICKRFPDRARDIIEGTIPAVPVGGRVDFESTSQGASGDFHEMFMQAWERGDPTLPVEYKAHFYNWTWDDEELAKTVVINNLPREFVEYQKLHKFSDIEISYYYQKWLSLNQNWNSLRREYPTTPEEAFDAIVEGTWYGVEMGAMERDKRITSVPYDLGLRVHTAWDLGVGENLVIGFYQKDKITGMLRKIDFWQGQEGDGLPQAIKAVLSKPYIYGVHLGPHDLESTDVGSGKTRMESAEELGLKFSVVPNIDILDGIESARLLLSKLIVDKEKCALWIKAMKNYIRLWDDKRGMYKDEPYHNWASHSADEFRYAAVGFDLMTDVVKSKAKTFSPTFTGYNRRG